MNRTYQQLGSLILILVCTLVAFIEVRARPPEKVSIRVRLIGFADRWANYGSRGDVPSFRDFLAIQYQEGKNRRMTHVKIRFQYWPQDGSDPNSFAKGNQPEKVLSAMRDTSCDETFASLSHEGDVSYLDPQLKPSRFVRLQGNETELPPSQMVLPCYEVR